MANRDQEAKAACHRGAYTGHGFFGTLGSLTGALFWYHVGLWLGCERLKRFARRHGRLLTLTPDEIDQADAWFDSHGASAVFFGRLIPTVRTLSSIPAGISDMTLRRFLVYTAAGTVLWTGMLAFAGWFLGSQYEVVGAAWGRTSFGTAKQAVT